MTQTLRDHAPVLICEVHGTNARWAAALEAHGYEAESLDGPGPVADEDPNAHTVARRAPGREHAGGSASP